MRMFKFFFQGSPASEPAPRMQQLLRAPCNKSFDDNGAITRVAAAPFPCLQEDDGCDRRTQAGFPRRTYKETIAMKSVLNALMLGAALAAFTPVAMAQSSAPAKPQAKAKAQKKAVKSNKADNKEQDLEDDKDLDVAKSSVTDLQCAHGDKVTLYENGDDNSHIGMRWKKHLLRMHRVETTTGANRFESRKHGLVWIGIPAKGMLLDSKRGLQLANECRSQAQVMAQSGPQEPAQPQLLITEAKK